MTVEFVFLSFVCCHGDVVTSEEEQEHYNEFFEVSDSVGVGGMGSVGGSGRD